MEFQEITTQRLILRKLTPEVYRHLHENLNDDELMFFFGFETEAALQKEKDKFAQGYTSYNRTLINFQLIERESGKVIGDCGYHTWSQPHKRAEIGYGLYNVANKRKGYMTEALKVVLDYGFNQMGLHRIEALAAPYNTASVKLLKNMGFIFEGTLRQHYNVNGKMDDSVMYSLLKHEFKI